MSVVTLPSDHRKQPATRIPVPLARAEGKAILRVERRGAESRLADLYQSGCAKIRFPAVYDAPFTGVLINTAGGLTGGDHMEIDVSVGPGATAHVSSQAAERLYRRFEGAARVETRLTVEQGAMLEWLPQEMIVFDQGAMIRQNTVDLAEGASFLGLESFVFGREAHGETVQQATVQDQWRISRDGRLVWADALNLSGDVTALTHPAGLGGKRAIATLVYAGPQAVFLRDYLRVLIADMPTEGVSLVGEVLVLRILAPDSASLRRRLEDIIGEMRCLIHGYPLPLSRGWYC